MAFSAVLQSEWTKIRTVASTSWTLALAFLVTVGFGAALCALVNATFDDLSEVGTGHLRPDPAELQRMSSASWP